MVVLGGISILPALVQGLHTKFPPKWLCLVSQMRGKLCLAVCFVSFLSTGILCINLSFGLIPNLWDNIEKIALAVWKCQLWSFDWWVRSNLLTHIDIVQRPRVLVSSPLSKRWIAQYYLKAPGLCMESLNRLAYLFFFFSLTSVPICNLVLDFSFSSLTSCLLLFPWTMLLRLNLIFTFLSSECPLLSFGFLTAFEN